ARCIRTDDPADPELLHRPDVRAVGNRMRWQLVVQAGPREESDALPTDLTHRERRRRLAVRRLHRHLLDVFEERVEARPAEHADLSPRHPPPCRPPPARMRAACWPPPG